MNFITDKTSFQRFHKFCTDTRAVCMPSTCAAIYTFNTHQRHVERTYIHIY